MVNFVNHIHPILTSSSQDNGTILLLDNTTTPFKNDGQASPTKSAHRYKVRIQCQGLDRTSVSDPLLFSVNKITFCHIAFPNNLEFPTDSFCRITGTGWSCLIVIKGCLQYEHRVTSSRIHESRCLPITEIL